MTRLEQESVVRVCCGQRSVNVVEFTLHNVVVHPSGAYDLFDVV